jgi:hypothetical protein
LDLGYPEVREVMNNRPDLDGADDRTALFGARAVSANIRARPGGTMTPDEIGTLFAPFMLPGVRPELHYVLDRPGEPERMAAVRASGYTWPISGARAREIHLGWIAADPAMNDPAERSVIAYAGSSTGTGRNYPLTYNRLYPPGGNSPSTATISSPGDIPIRPLLRIYGPITAPRVALAISDGSALEVRFVAGFIINAGRWVDVDAANRTVYADSDPTAPVVDRVDWQASTWPVLPVAPASTSMNLYGDSTAGVTQVEAIWHDRYLT